jgi:guanine deaminase
MREHIVETIKTSKLYWTVFPEYKPVSFSEAFYLATKGGGSFFGKVGSFEKGYQFDALVIDDENLINEIPHDLEERLERFVYVGSHENIVKKYVAGKLI